MNNQAAWIPAANARLEVKGAPTPQPAPHEVVIRNYAVAINPVDVVMQDMDRLITAYPSVLGSDSAGEIVAVGADVTDCAVGDRVVATGDVIETGKPSNGAFQLYSATRATMVGKISSRVSYTEASVLGMAMNTAAAGLYQKENMGLPYPHVRREPTGKTFLVWGGSGSVGSCAVQLVIASGYDVATTASAHNLDHCRSLGAKWVFDHSSPSVVEDIASALKGREFGGILDAVSKPDTLQKCGDIITQLGGYQFLQSILPARFPRPETLPEHIKFGQGKRSNKISFNFIYECPS